LARTLISTVLEVEEVELPSSLLHEVIEVPLVGLLVDLFETELEHCPHTSELPVVNLVYPEYFGKKYCFPPCFILKIKTIKLDCSVYDSWKNVCNKSLKCYKS